jgi:hypothetical protein
VEHLVGIIYCHYEQVCLVSPLAPIEQWYYGIIGNDKLLTVLTAQAIGGYSAFRIANGLWYYTLDYSQEHKWLYYSLPCAINYKVPFSYALGFEILGCFLIRMLISRLPEKFKHLLVPVVFASFLSFGMFLCFEKSIIFSALSYIGVPGLNPVTAASRLQGCPGLDLQWFMLTYWVAPVIGWLSAAALDRRLTLAKGGKNKKKK